MSAFDETTHARNRAGRFTEMAGSAPDGALPSPAPHADTIPEAYPLIDPDGSAITVSDDGDHQACTCGNDTGSGAWMTAGAGGRLAADLAGDGDEDLLNVCPSCGTFARQGDLSLGEETPALGRFDVNAPEFQQARSDYDRAAYGIG